MYKAILFDLDGTLLHMDQDAFLKVYMKQLLGAILPLGGDPSVIKAAFFKGVEAGRRSTIKIIYAAVLYAAREELKFGATRMDRLIKAVDRHVCDTLSSEEIIDNVYRDTGYRLTFADPFETIERVN